MHRKLVPVIALVLIASTGLAGCFDDRAGAAESGDAPAKTHRISLGLTQLMHHPAPGVMLSVWAFHELGDLNPKFPMEPIRVTEGDIVEVEFTNTFDFNHTIHWHGMHVPWRMDGIPYLSQMPIQPGESFTYRFEAKPAGTHFFHCHVDTPHHVDMGMYGVIIVEPKGGEKYPYDSEELLVLDDWDSSHLHQTGTGGTSQDDVDMTKDSTLDPSGDPFNQVDRTEKQVRDSYNNPQYPYVKDVYQNPAKAKRDWYPETYAPWQPEYDIFTINGYSFPMTEPIVIKENETKRLRMVNVGNTIFSMHVHGHAFRVTHKDGYPLDSPFWADTLLIGPGERYSVMLEGNNPGMWMLHDHIGLHGMNQHIYPGGAMTHMVYERFLEEDPHEGHGHGTAKRLTAGDFLGLYR